MPFLREVGRTETTNGTGLTARKFPLRLAQLAANEALRRLKLSAPEWQPQYTTFALKFNRHREISSNFVNDREEVIIGRVASVVASQLVPIPLHDRRGGEGS